MPVSNRTDYRGLASVKHIVTRIRLQESRCERRWKRVLEDFATFLDGFQETATGGLTRELMVLCKDGGEMLMTASLTHLGGNNYHIQLFHPDGLWCEDTLSGSLREALVEIHGLLHPVSEE